MLYAEGLKLLKNMKAVKEKKYFIKTRTSEAFIMIIPARFIQATLDPYLTALSIERTHYTTELAKNQEYFNAIFLLRRLKMLAPMSRLPLHRNIHKLNRSVFNRDINESHIFSESSA